MTNLKVLIAEDSENDCLLLLRELRKGGYDPDWARVDNESEMKRQLELKHWDIVLTDHNMPGFSSTDSLSLVKASGKDIPVVIVSGVIGEESAVGAMKAGAHDYIMKDNMVRLIPVIERELRDAQTRQDKDEAEKRLNHLSDHDPLTNLVNRSSVHDVLEGARSRAEVKGNMLAILYIDLDRFKVINDIYGHSVGDQVLIEVATRMRACARYNDTIARYGGDEFILIIENIVEAGEASVVAEFLIQNLAKPYHIEGHDITIGASVGIAFSDSVGWSAEELIQNADAAMYQAKSLGRNSFCHYSPEINEAAEHRRYLELSLHKALELNELKIYFQPQVDLKEGRIRGAEVLLRWQHSTLGLIPPDEFINLLEETGLIISVGEWVLTTASEQWCRWVHEGIVEDDAVLGVNISSYQFKGELVSVVKRVLDKTGIAPEMLDLELTEGTLMDNTEETQEALLALKDLGVQLSIDDFGTGYSSLGYLSRFPIDTLKIDKSFILGIGKNDQDAIITKTIIGLAENLGMHVIAEGVENPRAIDFLSAQDCFIYQGYYFGRPVPPQEFVKNLERFSVNEHFAMA